MSESSKAYSRWYDRVERIIDSAMAMAEQHEELVSPVERDVIADQIRVAVRRLSYAAETLDLHRPHG